MKALFLGSVVERSGKSMVTLGLAKNYPRRVGYFKPFKEVVMSVEDRVVDQDAYLMHEALGLPFGPEALSPFTYDVFEPVGMASILEEYRKLSAGADLMLVEGTRDITTGCMGSVSGMAIAQKVQADVVLVSSAQISALDKICMLRSYMDQYPLSFKGVVLNQVEDARMPRLLERRGIRVLGSIPPLRELKRFSVREVADAVGAEVLVGGAGMDDPVERVMVGAMTPETALDQMRRVSRKAIITGGDRADIQMAALSTDTSCLVLTGGLYPARSVVNRASEAGVPVLVTPLNTLEASEAVDHLIARIDPLDPGKIDLIAKVVRENVDLDAVYGEG
ncbi:DRTGG domain-containing protein [Methanomassiliicoccus luminyensis]|uniref:DRTGG domain-containing protein n=1 Tax=Methanomassiliicoccus luminyensis TaxID=1080712 RepID=UPI000364E52F|nr:DRTGG domain-containing protein [Methanomassiliicoccus luminyensis]